MENQKNTAKTHVGPERLFTEVVKSVVRHLGVALAAVNWLRNGHGMVLAGYEIERQLRLAASQGQEEAVDRTALLWQSYGKYGVTFNKPEIGLRREAGRKKTMVTTIEECVSLARAELKVAKGKLTKEIRNYPTPIAGCDCQFNHLLSERTRVSEALRALDLDIHTPSPKRL
ncbi:hypothetical protein [Pelagibius sp. Alg239-R121]|uniref:hypothetical protein n=1 Tax=Pelagibius sp. Alg239-R121 TaxID=2993448 RepID=UPI0024A73461|nr:hypothetical protein [Pelagibius sp. Alg239-R121]